MKQSLISENEKKRLATLRHFDVLDTLAEKPFDYMTSLAVAICKTPITLISLIDENRQRFKFHYGLDVDEIEWNILFCGNTILQSELLIVQDTLEDKRFLDNPLVTEAPLIRFYAGIPIITKEGHALGTLCVIDHVPRELTEDQQQSLRILRKLIISQLELRLSIKTMQEHFDSIHSELVGIDYHFVCCGTATPGPQPPFVAVLSGSSSVSVETKLPTVEAWYKVSSFPLYNKEKEQIGLYPS